MEVLYTTNSVCPVCLQSVHADVCRYNDEIRLVKNCQEHGRFEALIWRGEPDFLSWAHFKKNTMNTFSRQVSEQGNCPHNCGLCQAHRQRSCTVLFELTQDCNLHCPVCFANASPVSENAGKSVLPLARALEQLVWIREQAGAVVLQLSGGEPTLYPYLLDVVQAASKLFPAVQLNTNGLLLAENPHLAKELKEAGVSWVFLQCDGDTDSIHKALRGKALATTKHKAIQQCKDAGLAVVLVATVASGINDNKLGDLLRYGLSLFPTVRGIHLQPMTLSGRNNFSRNNFSGDNLLQDRPTLTLPEVITKLSQQSHGFIKAEHASPPSCEHALCSFHCRYYVNDDGNLEYIREQESCGCETNPNVKHERLQTVLSTDRQVAKQTGEHADKHAAIHMKKDVNDHENNHATQDIDAPQRAIDAVIRSWQGDTKELAGISKIAEISHSLKVPSKDAALVSVSTFRTPNSPNALEAMRSTPNFVDTPTTLGTPANNANFDAFDAFIARARSRTFSVTCMAFQDVHTLDIERLQGCCVHVFDGHDKLIPFCAYNLTSVKNIPLYRS